MGLDMTHALAPSPTGHECSDCEEPLGYTEEIVLLQIVHPHAIGQKVVFHQVFDEEDPDANGDFLFQPYFFCFTCWEEHHGTLLDETRDEKPIDDALSVIECTCCGSGIRDWEFSGTFTIGEFHPSKREPNHVRGPAFQPNGKPEVLCLYCIATINFSCIEMWDNLSMHGECVDCVHARCWRHEDCGCGCHNETEEEEIHG